ncbi:MAG TPA: UxaA family hydrolase [Caldilineaceae bacterium]|nr:UxaA family hydrolase [Caldilineaceae bacterium]
MAPEYSLHDVARLPLPGDNVAITTQRLEAGAVIVDGDRRYALSHTLLEGHRFAIRPIPAGGALLSWELPFGYATRAIEPGEYVCNAGMLEALSGRSIDFTLPAAPNFEDHIEPYRFDPADWKPVEQAPRYCEERTFMGYRRGGGRGVGTRNTIVLLGASSRTGSYVKQLEERVKGLAADYPNVDGIVAVAHTEGGSDHPNNLDLLLRTLAGFMVNPNVGAVLAVDFGVEPVTNQMLAAYLREHNYPIDDLPHRFLTLSGPFQDSLAEGEAQVRAWLPVVNETPRTRESLAHLKIALQCGGSDAFSGISGNPLAGWVAHEVIRYGGSANLAETDELIGAETYILQRVRDVETAQKFLATIERFKERVAWHGHSAEGNPSGGNKFRGLYNIVLKSIGAAMKKHPDTRLDYVIDYGERMEQPGYYFMDSPGNDLESIAGQIASGCNMIFFVTGNGSITNFPFVPTIKIVTTTRRYRLLQREMDVNAGAYLDGTPMDELGAQMLALTIDVASGRRSVGEKAGHAQVQIWRDWRQTDASRLEELLNQPAPQGKSLPIRTPPPNALPAVRVPALRTNGHRALDQVALILPTSLCAGQIARMATIRLNRKGLGRDHGISRFVSLVHTEGCGVSGSASEELYIRTMLGYVTHPMVAHCLLLEHGCEKTHNDYMRGQLRKQGIDPERLGWASVQLDGGIESVLEKIEAWFIAAIAGDAPPASEPAGLEALRLGLASAGPVSDAAARALAELTGLVVAAGGAVVVPQNAGLLSSPVYLAATLGDQPAMPTLAYGAPMPGQGFHVMETPTGHWVETLTGLGATGVEVMAAYAGEHPLQTHPMIPLLQITDRAQVVERFGADMDLALDGDPAAWPGQILEKIAAVAAHHYTPRLYQLGNVDFQVTRGLLGVSM